MIQSFSTKETNKHEHFVMWKKCIFTTFGNTDTLTDIQSGKSRIKLDFEPEMLRFKLLTVNDFEQLLFWSSRSVLKPLCNL